MAFVRPTLPELAERISADFVSRLALVGAVLRRSMVWVISMVLAGAAHMMHGHLDFLAAQLFADTADGVYLERIASLFGVDRLAATFATGYVTFFGTDTTVVPEGTIVTRDDGVQYSTDVEGIVGTDDPGEIWILATAVVAAELGNCAEHTALSLESPIAGITTVEVADGFGMTGGADEEPIEDLRVRVLERMRDPPNGGSEADYIAWAKTVAGVTRVWVHPRQLGAGTVAVYFVRDDDGDLIPSAPEVTLVQDALDEFAPVTAEPTALAPTAVAFDVEITIVPSNTTTQAAVNAAIAGLLLDEAAPGDPDDATAGVILLSHLETAIGLAEGVTDFTISDVNGGGAANWVPSTGEMAKMGTTTFL